MNWFDHWPLLLLVIALRYFLIAGIAFYLCYRLLRKRIAYRKIQLRFPGNKDYWREIGYSCITIVIFTITATLFLYTPLRATTQLYTHLSEHGYLWYIAAFPLMFLLHDAYFYWTHRLMHHPRLFPFFHLVHHRSTNPSPWTAFSFHPAEAVVEAGIFPLLLITMPLTILHFRMFFLLMLLYNVYAHLGWELYPQGFERHWLGKWLNTSRHHNGHHQHFKGNYGLYFLWWDRWMGTVR